MSVDKDVHLPPATAAVAQNPAEPIQLIDEAVAEKRTSHEAVVIQGEDGQTEKKKVDAGLGNYFVSRVLNASLHRTHARSECLPMARSWTCCSSCFASSHR